MAMTDDTGTTLARDLEERLVNVWPAVTTLMLDGWVVRFANGYSGRANSASALRQGARVDDHLHAQIEQLYVAQGLAPQFRISPVADAGSEAFLRARGYRVKDEALSMWVALPQNLTGDPRVAVEEKPQQAWLDGISRRQEPSKRSPQHLNAIVSRLVIPAGFATLRLESEDAGFAFSAIDRGWAELGLIMIDEKQRGRGLGRCLVTSLMAWAHGRGATHAFLQVDTNNTPALRLYESLGFAPAYTYRTLVKDAQT